MHTRPPKPRAPARDRTTTERAVLLLPVLSVVFIGAVHLEVQSALALLTAGVAALSLGSTQTSRAAPRATTLWIVSATSIWLIHGLVLAPVGPALRAKLQPLVAGPVEAGLALVGAPAHPLALAPAEATVGWAWGGALLLLIAAIALLHRPRERSMRMASTLTATGALIPLVAAAHRLAGAAEIWGWSGAPRATELRAAFYAPFVNPNHAGAFMAAVAPLAALVALRRGLSHRVGGGLALVALIGGVLSTGSRAAVLGLMLSLGLMGALAAPRRWATALVGLGAVLLGATLQRGPSAAAAWLDATLPTAQALRDPFGQRVALWADGWALASAQPLGPVGAGGFQAAWSVVRQLPTFGNARHAHQDALQSIVENSLPATIAIGALLLGLVGWAAGEALRSPRGRHRSQLAAWIGLCAALLAVGLVDFPAHIGALLMLLSVGVGELLAALGRSDRPFARGLWGISLPILGAVALGVWAANGHRVAPGGPLTRAAPIAEAARAQRLTKPEAARALTEAALRQEPLNLTALLTLAELDSAAGQPDRAAQALKAAVAAHPRSPWPHFAQAALYRQQGALGPARRATQRALENNLPDNDDARAWIDRALSAEAEPGLMVGQLIPQRADRLRDAASWLAAHNDPLMAAVVYTQAQALDPQINVPYARLLLNQGDAAGALRQLALAPKRGCEALKIEGEAQLQLRRSAEAVTALRAALAQCPAPTPALRASLGIARCEAGDTEGAALAEQALLEAPERHGVRHRLARCLVAQGRGRQALPHLQALSAEGLLSPDEKRLLTRLEAGLPR